MSTVVQPFVIENPIFLKQKKSIYVFEFDGNKNKTRNAAHLQKLFHHIVIGRGRQAKRAAEEVA